MTQSLSPTSPTPPVSSSSTTTSNILSPITKPTANVLSPLPKPTLKVSFKDKIKMLQQGVTQSSAPAPTPPVDKETTLIKNSDNMKEQLIPPPSSSVASIKLTKPSTSNLFKDKIRSLGQQKETEILKPWSKLKLATVVSTGGSYSSLNNSVCDDTETTTANMTKMTVSATTTLSKPLTVASTIKSNASNLLASLKPIQPVQPLMPLQKPLDDFAINNKSKYSLSSKNLNENISVSDSEVKSSKSSNYSNDNIIGINIAKPSRPINNSSEINKITRKHKKCYRSVDDLSPEYGGLPFVKKLKILNERQKLAELESVIQTRSFSLDCSESGSNLITELMEPLTRSHSEASAIGLSTNVIQIAPLNKEQKCLDTCTTITSSTTAITANRVLPLYIPVPIQPPLSPNESNETLERRHLKSILKKLSEDQLTKRDSSDMTQQQQQQQSSYDNNFHKKESSHLLLKEPTLEGYVARHSKLIKSVTFNNTLSSPPSTLNLCDTIDDHTSYNAQPPSIDNPNNIIMDDDEDDDTSIEQINKMHFVEVTQIDSTSPNKNKHFLQSVTNQKMFIKGK